MPPPAAAAAAMAQFTAPVSMVLPSAAAPNDLTSNGGRPFGSSVWAHEADAQASALVALPAATKLVVADLRKPLRQISMASREPLARRETLQQSVCGHKRICIGRIQQTH